MESGMSKTKGNIKSIQSVLSETLSSSIPSKPGQGLDLEE
jgi:hypothetical protein